MLLKRSWVDFSVVESDRFHKPSCECEFLTEGAEGLRTAPWVWGEALESEAR